MDKKTFTIGVLSLSAVMLLAANLIQPRTADAAFVVRDNDYTAVTARVSKGGEGLYILDNRTGMMSVLTYDAAKKGIIPLAKTTPLTDAFAGKAGGGAGGGAKNGGVKPGAR